jgi:hypothetical protein
MRIASSSSSCGLKACLRGGGSSATRQFGCSGGMLGVAERTRLVRSKPLAIRERSTIGRDVVEVGALALAAALAGNFGPGLAVTHATGRPGPELVGPKPRARAVRPRSMPPRLAHAIKPGTNLDVDPRNNEVLCVPRPSEARPAEQLLSIERKLREHRRNTSSNSRHNERAERSRCDAIGSVETAGGWSLRRQSRGRVGKDHVRRDPRVQSPKHEDLREL